MASFSSQRFNPSSLASRGELLARQYYESQGWGILAINLFNRQGKRVSEIDFIAINHERLCFVEVKTRSRKMDRFGGVRQAVDNFKQRKLRKLAYLFLLRRPSYRQLTPQIDVCLVEANELDKSGFSVTIIPHAVEEPYR
jgi:putative endonuclease